ncbi:unnamed protein product [Kuraishia capsulata CBS 1993]|uniref:Glycoside hydrolase family 17 protein n=1 Tax=Kuraishia capsulata CBS 1993 TaxID=1382522 RepID=W6MMN2_9ASCO|nr:uncharacterized protein KUCA_T00002183001 [Kuraishia capsulata CBS 1993]CDK26212.1 unnamed protein product [Kuraishia capsulata CBS 1993]
MKYSALLLWSFVPTLIAALPHNHHFHKREAHAAPEVVTVLVTQVVTMAGPGSSDPTTLQTSFVSSATEPAALPSSVVSSKGASAKSSAKSATKASAKSSGSPYSSSIHSSASSSSAVASSTATSEVSSYAEKSKGIAYSPYTDSGSCKSSDVIQSDIQLLSAFDYIRVYAPDCSCVENIMAVMGDNQKLFAGLYYMDSLTTDIETLSSAVESSSQGWDGVYAVSVGNEWVNSGDYSVSQVSAAVSSARSALSDKGYSGYVVSVDTLVAVQDNTDLCDVSDFIAVNSHPFWDGNVLPEDSGTFLKTQIANIYKACGSSKDVLICETGWPTQGDTYGVAVPSKENQLTAIKAIVEEVGDQVLMFTTYNDYWKDGGSYGVEKYWGIFE